MVESEPNSLYSEISSTPNIRYFVPCTESVLEYRSRNEGNRGEIIPLDKQQETLFELLLKHGRNYPPQTVVDVYNPSVPFTFNGEEYIAGRVEPRGKEFEHDSLTVFFNKDHVLPVSWPVHKLQDPKVIWIDKEMVISGVEIITHPENNNPTYRMVFYKGKSPHDLVRFTEGPLTQKGINIKKLKNGKIVVYTRPQGEKGGLGQMGFTTIDSLIQLTPELIQKAPLLNYRFPPGEWGGINQIIDEFPLLPTDCLLNVSHRAYRDKFNQRHYLVWAFVHDLLTDEIFDLGVLAERRDFPSGPTKAEDLMDVVYTAGLTQKNDKIYLTVGLSDTQCGQVEIPNPLRRLYQKKSFTWPESYPIYAFDISETL